MKKICWLVAGFLLVIHVCAQKSVDLFIWAGQSNAQGWMGNAAYYPKEGEELDDSILFNWTFVDNESSGGRWLKMQPQKGRFPNGHFGPEVSFARELKKAGFAPAIFKYTKGATGLARDWKAPGDGGIYDNMVKDLKSAIQELRAMGFNVNICGFIWIQGESDAGDENAAAEYQVNLMRMINDLRVNVLQNQNLKIILGVDEQHSFVQKRPVVVEAQKKIALEDKNIIYTTMYGLPKADATHLTPAGLVGHGKRIFTAFKHLNEDSNTKAAQKTFADKWEYVGIAVEEPGYTIWGTSPVYGDDGKVHLFVARWPCELKVDPGWRTHSEIAHYTGDSPVGPFHRVEVIGKGKGNGHWNAAGFHNPSIKKIDNKYVLVYIANNGAPLHGPNQRIGMLVGESFDGPWKEIPNDKEPLLSPPDDSTSWCYNSGCGVNNPALLKHPDGRYFLYFKSMTGPRPEGKVKMGLAIADKLEGPYIIQPEAITTNDRVIEDGYAFMYEGKFALLTTDNHGMIEEGGGILWTSEDGTHFNEYEKGFHLINDYTDIDMEQVAVHYGPKDREYAKFERPQILLKEGKPDYMFVPSGTNIYGGDCTVSYVLKFKSE